MTADTDPLAPPLPEAFRVNALRVMAAHLARVVAGLGDSSADPLEVLADLTEAVALVEEFGARYNRGVVVCARVCWGVCARAFRGVHN